METVTADAELLERYRAALPSFVKPMFAEPISIDRGEGSYVWSNGGERYLDFFGGVLTTMIGHAHPKVVAAVQAQAAKVMHSSTLYLNEPMIELAEKICALSGIPDARVFFTKFRRQSRPTGPGRDARPTPRLVTDQRTQVAAPDWVLPAGAVLAIATALLPLALKDGEEAAEEIFQQDESVRSLDSRKNRRV